MMANVNELKLDLTSEAAHQQKINALNASKKTFYICNVKAPKAKKCTYTNLKINGTNNYLCTRVDTAADVNLLPATVYTQIYEDPHLEHLGPMDTSLSVYNDSAIQVFGTCTIPLVSPINGHIHETKFYVANHSGSVLFSCEDSLYMELIQPHHALSKHAPHNVHIILSEHDTAYINFITRNKNTSHYCETHPRTPLKTKLHDNSVPHNLDHIKQKYADIFKALVPFWEIHTTSSWTPQYHLCEYLVGQYPSTNKESLNISLATWNKLM